MLSPALASTGRAAAEPAGTRCAEAFADRATAALVDGGAKLTADPLSLQTGELRFFAKELRTGSLLVEVVENPWATDRAVLESRAAWMRSQGFRARVFAGGSLLLICAERGSR